jgi:hypothetical protein
LACELAQLAISNLTGNHLDLRLALKTIGVFVVEVCRGAANPRSAAVLDSLERVDF